MEEGKIFFTGLRVPEYEFPSKLTLYHFPTIEIEYLKVNSQELSQALEESSYVVFFSQNGVKGTLLQSLSQQEWLHFLSKTQIWVTGEKTAETVQKKWQLSPSLPKTQNARGLIACFEQLSPQSLVLFSAKNPRHEFLDWLRQNNWHFFFFPVYQTVTRFLPEWKTHFHNRKDEYLLFTSPSTVEGFLLNLQLDDFTTIEAKILSIGPTTSSEILARKGKVYQEAQQPQVERFIAQLVASEF